jgi:transcriptional regulator with XRE-family HTH domain
MPPSALRLRRLALGLTAEDVAREAGLNRRWVGVLERGGASPTWRTALALAEVLEADPRELFPSNDDGPAANRTEVTTKPVAGAHHATDPK